MGGKKVPVNDETTDWFYHPYVHVNNEKELQRWKFYLFFLTLICCRHRARNISTGKTKHFFNNQINKTLCAQPTESRISEVFYKKKQRILSPVALSLICSGSHFLMLRKALHLCATGDQLRHWLWLKTVWDWKKNWGHRKKEKCFTSYNFIPKLVLLLGIIIWEVFFKDYTFLQLKFFLKQIFGI